MQPFLKQLISINQLHPFERKILLVHSVIEGQTLIQTLALSGYSTLNLEPTTLIEFLDEVIPTTSERVPNIILDHLIWQILTELAKAKQLQYFCLDNISFNLASVVRQAITTLKNNRIDVEDLDPSWFICEEKAKDLKQIYVKYQHYLDLYNWLDSGDLLKLGLNCK